MHPQALVTDVLDATEGIDVRAAAERFGDRVDRQVAPRQVGLDRVAASGSRSTCQLRSRATTRQTPNPSDSLNGRAGAAGQRPSQPSRIVADRDIEVRCRASEQPVANRPADKPRSAR